MASGLKMMILGIIWVAIFVTLILFAIAGDVVFKMVTFFQNIGIPMTVLNYDLVQGIFPFFYVLILVVEILVTYRLYEEAVSDVNSYPGLL
jgi:TRAP-type C4-dicarboxylate transport system permease small subunit